MAFDDLVTNCLPQRNGTTLWPTGFFGHWITHRQARNSRSKHISNTISRIHLSIVMQRVVCNLSNRHLNIME